MTEFCYFHNAIADAIGSAYTTQSAIQDRQSAQAVLATEEMQAIKRFLCDFATAEWNALPRATLLAAGLPESVARWVMA